MKKSTIIIEGAPFSYDDEMEDISYETISAISEIEAKELLEKTKDLFEPLGLDFYLSFGTLLGAVRDHTIIKGDEDVDIFVEDESLLRKSIPSLHESGYSLCRVFEGVLYSFRINGSRSYIDIYIKKPLPLSIWSLWCDCLYGRAVPRRLLNQKGEIDFLGSKYKIPKNPERILAFWYGKDWRTPKRGHNYTYEVASRYWWRTKVKDNDHWRWLVRRYFTLWIKRPIKILIGWDKWKR